MDYTTSIDNVVHGGTGHRMHSDSIAVPTAWSGNDSNMLVWSLMEVLRLAGVSGKAFNPDDPTSYTRFRDALVATFAGLDSPAFRGSPQAPLPPQFDNTTKLATTSFVQRAIGNMQTGSRIISAANATFSAMQAGGAYTLEVASTTYVLPSLASVRAGASFEFLATVNEATISTVGNDKMMTGSLVSASTCILNNGDTARFVSDGAYWVLIGGSASLRLSLGDFGGSLSVNGYSKLPNGRIYQAGYVSCPTNYTAGTVYTFTLPIAFPNEHQVCIASNGGTNTFVAGTQSSPGSLSTGRIVWGQSSVTAGGLAAYFISIGR